MLRHWILILLFLLMFTKGCEIHYEQRVLEEGDFKKELSLIVEDSSMRGERVATFEVVGSNDVIITWPENSIYLEYFVSNNNRTLDIRLNQIFEHYELYEYSPIQRLGAVEFNCRETNKQYTLHLKLQVKDSNNHSPEFINSDEFVYLIKLPVKPGQSLMKIASGPEIAALDLDLTNKNISFKIYGAEDKFKAVYLRKENDKWPLHYVDIINKVELKEKKYVFHIIAEDSGKPSNLGVATIFIEGSPPPKKKTKPKKVQK